MNDKLTEQQKADAFEKWWGKPFMEDPYEKQCASIAFHAGAEAREKEIVEALPYTAANEPEVGLVLTDYEQGWNDYAEAVLKAITARATDNSTGV